MSVLASFALVSAAVRAIKGHSLLCERSVLQVYGEHILSRGMWTGTAIVLCGFRPDLHCYSSEISRHEAVQGYYSLIHVLSELHGFHGAVFRTVSVQHLRLGE